MAPLKNRIPQKATSYINDAIIDKQVKMSYFQR